MLKKLAALAVALLFLGPSVVLVGVAAVVNPAMTACAPGSLIVGPIPDSLTATTRGGETVTLNRQQLTHAATIITVGSQTAGVGRPGVVIALMAALTESHLRMLANTGAYPESGNYPNDGNGSDHDSLGLFQMRPQSGWGSVAELMDPDYQARAFFGGPTGPNYPSPRGLLDIPGWQSMDPGEAAQAVEVSAYPDRYQNYQPVAEAILSALIRPAPTGNGGSDPVVPETTRIVFPLPEGTWVRTSPFGWRTHPITGERSFHTGSDFRRRGRHPDPRRRGRRRRAGGVLRRVRRADRHRAHRPRAAGCDVLRAHVAARHPRHRRADGHRRAAHRRCRLQWDVHRPAPALRGLPRRARRGTVDGDAWLTEHGAEGISGGDTALASCTAGGGL